MGMPGVIITFRENQETFLYRLGRGMVCYVHIASSASTPEYYTIQYKTATDKTLESATEKDKLIPIVKQMFDYGANKVIIAVAKAFTDVEDWLLMQRFNYLAVVSAADADAGVIEWAEGINYRAGRKFMLFTDSTQPASKDEYKRYLASIYPTVASGIPYGTPMDLAAVVAGLTNRSATFYVLAYNDKLTDEQLALYPGARSATANEKINAGQVCIVNDGEKIKVGRGVTTYYHEDAESPERDTTESKLSKIRAVDILNMIEDDIRDNFEEQFIGENNAYEDKMSFINAVNGVYFAGLLGTALNPNKENYVDIDLEKHIEYIKMKGEDPSTMTEMQIRKYDTGDNLFLHGSVCPMPTMEDMEIVFDL